MQSILSRVKLCLNDANKLAAIQLAASILSTALVCLGLGSLGRRGRAPTRIPRFRKPSCRGIACLWMAHRTRNQPVVGRTIDCTDRVPMRAFRTFLAILALLFSMSY